MTSPIPRTPRGDKIARVISLTNQSGGAGKTTSAVNIGACAADLGYTSVVIDADAQCDASAAVATTIPMTSRTRPISTMCLPVRQRSRKL
ncbi:ParA family protein [Streptomyces parvulus]|nr:ParA family protein [Streptomyces parvulus]